MKLSTLLTTQLNDNGFGDIIKAFRLILKTKQAELNQQNKLLNNAVGSHSLMMKYRIANTQEEIASLKFTFQQLTGLQFGSDLQILEIQ